MQIHVSADARCIWEEANMHLNCDWLCGSLNCVLRCTLWSHVSPLKGIFWQINITINNLIIQFIHAPIKSKLQTIGVSIGTLGLYKFLQTCQLPNRQHMSIKYYCVQKWHLTEIQAFLFLALMGHFTIVFSVPWALKRSKAKDALVLLQTFRLFTCRWSCSQAC